MTLKKELKIIPELEAFLDPLSEEEFEGLEKSIVEYGCMRPITVWRDNTIIDGHNRYRICQKHNIDFSTEPAPSYVANMDDVKIYMIDEQCSRRNLNPTRHYHYLSMRDELRGRAKMNQKQSQGRGKKGLSNWIKPINTQKENAKAAGISTGQAARIDYVKHHGSDEIIKAMLDEEISVNKAYTIVKAQQEPPPEPVEEVDDVEQGEEDDGGEEEETQDANEPCDPPKRSINQKALMIIGGVVDRLSEIRTNDIEKVQGMKLLVDWMAGMRLNREDRKELSDYFKSKIKG